MPYVESVRLGNVVETLAQESHKPARLPELIVSSQFLRKINGPFKTKRSIYFRREVCMRTRPLPSVFTRACEHQNERFTLTCFGT